jgi:hypothetical protein
MFKEIIKVARNTKRVSDVVKNQILAEENYQSFNRWMSIMHGRTHSMNTKQWDLCRNQNMHSANNKRLNTAYLKDSVCSLVPLLDLANHRQAYNRDYSDLVSFKFEIIKEEKASERKTGLIALIDYETDQEYSYSYSKDLDAILLMISYGMAFDNSPFAMITIPMANGINQLSS